MNTNKHLKQARNEKMNEFETLYAYIRKELKHYRNRFYGATVVCNCDNPYRSNFFRYFVLNFSKLGLNRLVTTNYADNGPDNRTMQLMLFDDDEPEEAKTSDTIEYRHRDIPYRSVITNVPFDYEINGTDDIDELFKLEGNGISRLDGDGSYSSIECTAILKEERDKTGHDKCIVVSNPPWSELRNYVAFLERMNVNYIFIGNTNMIICKSIFPLVCRGRLFLGYTCYNTGMYFRVPDDFDTFHRIDRNGSKLVRVSTACWFTSFQMPEARKPLKLTRRFSDDPSRYPFYDNYNAIEVGRVPDIPMDFPGVMGVPVTFLDYHDPSRFQIVGSSQRGCHAQDAETKRYDEWWEVRQDGSGTGCSGCKINGNPNLPGDDGIHNYFMNESGEKVHSLYTRIFICNKTPVS